MYLYYIAENMSTNLEITHHRKIRCVFRPCHGKKSIMAGFQETQAIFSPAMIPYDLFGEFYVSILGPLGYQIFQRPRANVVVC
jgi:hypothetical protein